MKVALQVSEHALDPLSSLSGADGGFGAAKGTDLIARIFGDEARDGALPGRRALRLERARGAVGRATAISADLACPHDTPIGQELVVWAVIGVGIGFVPESVAGEEAVALSGSVDHRHMRRDAFVDQPTE